MVQLAWSQAKQKIGCLSGFLEPREECTCSIGKHEECDSATEPDIFGPVKFDGHAQVSPDASSPEHIEASHLAKRQFQSKVQALSLYYMSESRQCIDFVSHPPFA